MSRLDTSRNAGKSQPEVMRLLSYIYDSSPKVWASSIPYEGLFVFDDNGSANIGNMEGYNRGCLLFVDGRGARREIDQYEDVVELTQDVYNYVWG